MFFCCNGRILRPQNPHVICQTPRFLMNIQAGIYDRIGSLVLPRKLKAKLSGKLTSWTAVIERLQNMWFMHDGASAHFRRNVRKYLNQTPTRSLDLKPLDFHLWDYHYYVQTVNEQQLVDKIMDGGGILRKQE